MKIPTKILLATVFVSAFGFGGFMRTTYAVQLPSYLVVTPHHHSSIQVAEADSPNDSDSGTKEDGDREASDVTKATITRTHRSSQTKQQVKYHRKHHHTKRQQAMLR